MKIGLYVALISVAFSMAAKAQDTPPDGVYNDWQVLCGGDRCRLAQTLISPEDGLQVLRVRVFRGEDPTLVLTVPLGVFLKPGVIIKVDDGRARAYAYEICDAEGCHAGMALDAELLRSFKRGITAKISFFDGTQMPIEVPVSLIGFTSGFAALGS